MKPKTHGGRRPGAGRKPSDPESGNREMLSVRVHPDTKRRLAALAARPEYDSQGVVIDVAVERLFSR